MQLNSFSRTLALAGTGVVVGLTLVACGGSDGPSFKPLDSHSLLGDFKAVGITSSSGNYPHGCHQ